MNNILYKHNYCSLEYKHFTKKKNDKMLPRSQNRVIAFVKSSINTFYNT